MAVIALSRQVASLGDEIAAAAAEKLGYTFIGKKELEERIVAFGFPTDKLKKYDERKPGFFASLVKDRDEYLDYLQTAAYEAASVGNCILIGRGSSIILSELPNLVSVRLIAPDEVRLFRLEKEFSWSKKQAQQRIDESDANRNGFYKSFFNTTCDNPVHFHFIINTGFIDTETGAALLTDYIRLFDTIDKEQEGKLKLRNLLAAQHLVNKMVFEYNIAIEFLRAVIIGKTVTLYGVADSTLVVERALHIAAEQFPGYEIQSSISIIQNFKAYP